MKDEKATLPVENKEGFDTPVADMAPPSTTTEETEFDEDEEDSDDDDEDSDD